jgi:hypothetical protein
MYAEPSTNALIHPIEGYGFSSPLPEIQQQDLASNGLTQTDPLFVCWVKLAGLKAAVGMRSVCPQDQVGRLS